MYDLFAEFARNGGRVLLASVACGFIMLILYAIVGFISGNSARLVSWLLTVILAGPGVLFGISLLGGYRHDPLAGHILGVLGLFLIIVATMSLGIRWLVVGNGKNF